MIPGERLIGGRYRLGPLIGRGGMATIHRGIDQHTGRAVAVKLLRPEITADADLGQRFRREALAATVLRHPNIVACLDTGTEGDQPFLIMELVEGEDLAALLKREGHLSPWQVRRIGLDVARAMGAAHMRGIVHRDIKPGNILLATDGRAMVTDFGIARLAMDAEAAVPGTTLGSVYYFSPEQVRGVTTTPASDVYGLGLVLYEALTGQRAWSGATSDAIALARLGGAAPSPRVLAPDVSPALDALVRRALAPQAADRFPNGATMASALESIGVAMSEAGSTPVMPGRADGGPGGEAASDANPPAPRLPRGRARAWSGSAAVAALAAVGLVAGVLLVAALPGAAGVTPGQDPARSDLAAATPPVSTQRPEQTPVPGPTSPRTTAPSAGPTSRPTPAGTPGPTPLPADRPADLCEIFFELPCGLDPGAYSPRRFAPALDLELETGWSAAVHESDLLTLTREEGRLTIASGVTDIYPDGELESTRGRARDLIEAFTVTRGSSATRPVRVRIDGRRGLSVDLSPIEPEPVPLFSTSGSTFYLEPGRTTRLVAIDARAGTLVLAIEPGPDRTLDEILQTADDVAGSIRQR